MYTGFETPGRTAAPPRNLARGASTWFLLAACFLFWPTVFAAVITATFLAAVIVLDAGVGSPIGWLLVGVASAIAYSVTVGLPLALCALQQRWYLRLIPVLIIAVPIVWMITLVGVWALPGAGAIALSIALEATGARDRATLRLWAWLTASRRR
ncbi:hypothetical protein [Glycomyces algeriensis]|uniref:Uncharacterized protein n=1 Tax=Glycomyces algeriensis TaxID=256037 RepID=A0A9W6GBT6_9ACTN|nr:hypothetical protein [Glycomyces algeriensis]MDA1365523.1 hypothetical protein [Glycomyces algeriensis]MDR7351209.1 hypothetical protein [Glycomyces algeriensis]GLI43922.1 hypothetical protein GALLR39Z86_37720 [Glycomyces algeriensis]